MCVASQGLPYHDAGSNSNMIDLANGVNLAASLGMSPLNMSSAAPGAQPQVFRNNDPPIQFGQFGGTMRGMLFGMPGPFSAPPGQFGSLTCGLINPRSAPPAPPVAAAMVGPGLEELATTGEGVRCLPEELMVEATIGSEDLGSVDRSSGVNPLANPNSDIAASLGNCPVAALPDSPFSGEATPDPGRGGSFSNANGQGRGHRSRGRRGGHKRRDSHGGNRSGRPDNADSEGGNRGGRSNQREGERNRGSQGHGRSGTMRRRGGGREQSGERRDETNRQEWVPKPSHASHRPQHSGNAGSPTDSKHARRSSGASGRRNA